MEKQNTKNDDKVWRRTGSLLSHAKTHDCPFCSKQLEVKNVDIVNASSEEAKIWSFSSSGFSIELTAPNLGVLHCPECKNSFHVEAIRNFEKEAKRLERVKRKVMNSGTSFNYTQIQEQAAKELDIRFYCLFLLLISVAQVILFLCISNYNSRSFMRFLYDGNIFNLWELCVVLVLVLLGETVSRFRTKKATSDVYIVSPDNVALRNDGTRKAKSNMSNLGYALYLYAAFLDIILLVALSRHFAVHGELWQFGDWLMLVLVFGATCCVALIIVTIVITKARRIEYAKQALNGLESGFKVRI
ncbi:MAG: hypothetical protein FWD45_05825 [Coriobacteriia bacterium]|nr:hypothetical protein [Coriobacteriia bacterium]